MKKTMPERTTAHAGRSLWHSMPEALRPSDSPRTVLTNNRDIAGIDAFDASSLILCQSGICLGKIIGHNRAAWNVVLEKEIVDLHDTLY